MDKVFYSNGKLLLTGEYAVLDGALSLAVPTVYGQSLTIKGSGTSQIIWKSLDDKNCIWFECTFELKELQSGIQKETATSTVARRVSEMLFKILIEAKKINPRFLATSKGYEITAKLSFPRNWGLGTSSTLINNIATWAKINAFKLLDKTFGGSGYDIACTQYNSPILYVLKNGIPTTEEIPFDPSFKAKLFFVYLNKKQNSRDGIAKYLECNNDTSDLIAKVSEITRKISRAKNLPSFESLLTTHENLISNTLKIKTVKDRLFADYTGAIKSLGAWGGDFILVTRREAIDYFPKKGYPIIIPYSNMVLAESNIKIKNL